MKALPFLLLCASSVVLCSSVSHAAPLQFALGPPLPAVASGKKKPVAKAQQQPGEIRTSEVSVEQDWSGREQELWQGGRKIIAGEKIGGRSFAGKDPVTGTWAVSIIQSSRFSPCEGSSSQIALVPLHGEPRFLTFGGMMSEDPLISPDGTTIAFTGIPRLPSPQMGEQFLFLCDVVSGESICVSGEDAGSGRWCYHAGALSWSADSRTLTFSQSWQQDGSDETRRTVTLCPAVGPAHPLKFELAEIRDPEESTLKAGVARFLDPATFPGEVREPAPGVAELWQGDRKIFSARSIGRRSWSGSDPATGTWVVAAVRGDRPPIGDRQAEFIVRDGQRVLDASPSAVYLITPDGASRCISLPHTDAASPLISPDGATVAFSSGPIFEDGSAGPKKIYLYDVASSELTYAAGNRSDQPENGAIAFSWRQDGRALVCREYDKKDEAKPYGPFRMLTLLPKE